MGAHGNGQRRSGGAQPECLATIIHSILPCRAARWLVPSIRDNVVSSLSGRTGRASTAVGGDERIGGDRARRGRKRSTGDDRHLITLSFTPKPASSARVGSPHPWIPPFQGST